MPEYQTTVDNAKVIRGSGLVEVANYTTGEPTWFTVGAITGLTIEEQMAIAKEENDNADSTDRVAKQEVVISFTMVELFRTDALEIMRSGLDTIVIDSNETKVFSGNSTELPIFMVRTTTLNNGTPYYFMAYKCNLQKGFSHEFPADDAEDARVKEAVEIIGKTDSNRNGYVYHRESEGFIG